MPWTTQGLAAPPGEPPPITDAPSSSHTTNCPVLLLIQRMSLLLAPLKPPVSAIAHGIGTEPGEPPPITDVPFTNHTTVCPVLVLRQRMSAKPSPLKSPVPKGCQGGAA